MSEELDRSIDRCLATYYRHMPAWMRWLAAHLRWWQGWREHPYVAIPRWWAK